MAQRRQPEPLPILERIRNAVDCYVAAQPVPYRTTEQQPTFQSLSEEGHKRAFPLALDLFLYTRFEMADFAAVARPWREEPRPQAGASSKEKTLGACRPKPPLAIPPRPQVGASWLFPVNLIGICCGAGPHHVRAMAEALGRQIRPANTRPTCHCTRCSAQV
jgi:betaine-homocysteine S-methyltransferase